MSYYKKQIPEIIDNLKIAIDQCKEIISQNIDPTLADDKLHNVLKAKRMATEDIKFYAKEIDILNDELHGKKENQSTEEEEKSIIKKFTKQ